ncbi:MAG: nitroreductase family protein [Armatimonadetes bacterium]|nr:nitroreductase family protein [Armatimonadota bacterium]MCX7968214.1 nitroreductase family protein [Armatimonadota bacterium]MDW8143358.1 nitroreductase family protein [Armatimonadota bacterium]
MDFFEVLRRRYSVRAYKPDPIDEDTLTKILEAVNSAPSAGNLQAYEVIVVRDPERKRQLARASWDQMFIAQAPVVLVFVANPERNRRYGKRGAELYCLQDATIACSYAQLAAVALGLGSCWIGAFDDDAVRKVVEIPPTMRPVAILPIGVPADMPETRERRPLSDLVHEEQLGK